ncbi:hypothetical protein C6497_13100 [Candidatus Poribacteria bacterium]|nr:MAG: hypothetical protein C6497_13100 [Candidatus Poribacteria bacterium]
MMKNDDVAIIQRVLAGDETAFAELVKKYQKQVQALAWRKIEDFHIAEDITQDTFLKVYQKLHTLKDPNQFSGWLYVITTNLCSTWLRKKRIRTERLEDAEITMRDNDVYSRHITEDRHKSTVDAQRETVRKLLAKLKESERTVMTLHYLGEMTIEEISRFLGVSGSTIKSRLRRARNRLQKEETMIREALEHFQISPNMTENIMQKVSRLKPTPSGSKPFIPWTVVASTAVLIALMLGIGNQHLARFQIPYSLEAQSEMSVELVEAPIVQDMMLEPEVRNQLGSANAVGEGNTPKTDPDEVLLAAAALEGDNNVKTKQQWIQSEPIEGSRTYSMFSTSKGELYVLGGPNPSIFKLSNDGKEWEHLFDIISLKTGWGGKSPLIKWNDTLYFVPSYELFSSSDDGKTWNLLYTWSKEHDAVQFVATEQTIYLAFSQSIYRSEDNGKTWDAMDIGVMGDIISLVEIQNILFAGTQSGLYRFEGDKWQRLDFPVSVGMIRSIAVTDEKLYVAAELSGDIADPRKMSRGLQRSWWIFRSTDLGDSWTDITPTHAWNVKGFPPFTKLLAVGETILVMEKGMVRSTNSGDTWLPVQEPGTTPSINGDVDVAVVVNKNDLYISSADDGLHKSTDGGETWNKVNLNRVGSVDNLIALRAQHIPVYLYARTGDEIKVTINQGVSWRSAQEKISMLEPNRKQLQRITHIDQYDGVVYAKGGDTQGRGKTFLYQISPADGITLMPIQNMPVFDSVDLYHYYMGNALGDNLLQQLDKTHIDELLQKVSPGATAFYKQLAKCNLRQLDIYMQLAFRTGSFAVSNNTYYMEYNYKLFRWEPGDTEWHDTGVEETIELTLDIAWKGLKLAASGNFIYVGKRDGHLVVSHDKGNNWVDLTQSLPFPVKDYKQILVAGSTVYVVTDAGVTSSDHGNNWGPITNTKGSIVVMESLAVDGNILYGVTKDSGIYRLKNGIWEQIVSDIPDNVNSLAVDRNTLYVGSETQGMLHYNLE